MSPVCTQPRKARIAYRKPLEGNWQSWLTPDWELGTFCSKAGSWGDRAVTTAAPTAPLYRITDCTRLSQKHPTTSSINFFLNSKYFGRRFCFELNTKFYIHQASIQNKRRTQPIQTKQNSWCPFWIKPALLLACSPFWVYFELSAGETKEDGAVWRIRGAEKNTAENGKERENRISLIFDRGKVFKRISEWSIGAIKFACINWPWRLLIAKWHHTHKMNENNQNWRNKLGVKFFLVKWYGDAGAPNQPHAKIARVGGLNTELSKTGQADPLCEFCIIIGWHYLFKRSAWPEKMPKTNWLLTLCFSLLLGVGH